MRALVSFAVAIGVAALCGGQSAATEKRSSEFRDIGDVALWRSLTLDAVINDLRCRGFSPNQSQRIYKRRFEDRDRAVYAAIRTRYGPQPVEDIILIGKKCPVYRGVIEAHGEKLRELEIRLGLSK